MKNWTFGKWAFYLHIPFLIIINFIDLFLAEQYKFARTLDGVVFSFFLFLISLLFGIIDFETDINVSLSFTKEQEIKEKKSSVFPIVILLNLITIIQLIFNIKNFGIVGLVSGLSGKDHTDNDIYLFSSMIPSILFVFSSPFRRINRIEKMLLEEKNKRTVHTIK